MNQEEERSIEVPSRKRAGLPHSQDPAGYTPRALFINVDGTVFPDYLICSGKIPSDLGGEPCPYSVAGRIPDLVQRDETSPIYSIDKGEPGDLCPPCAKQKLGHLGHWQGHRGQQFPEHLLPLRLFKCRQ